VPRLFDWSCPPSAAWLRQVLSDSYKSRSSGILLWSGTSRVVDAKPLYETEAHLR